MVDISRSPAQREHTRQRTRQLGEAQVRERRVREAGERSARLRPDGYQPRHAAPATRPQPPAQRQSRVADYYRDWPLPGPREATGGAFRGSSKALMAEFVLALLIVAAKPFTRKSQVKAGQGKVGTITQVASLMLAFLVLDLVGAGGPRAQKAANMFGGIIVLALVLHNHAEIVQVIGFVGGGQQGQPQSAEAASAGPGPEPVGPPVSAA